MYKCITKAHEDVKRKYNGMISDMLTSPWLDIETVQAFTYEQKILQRYPGSLAVLVNKIKTEIDSRVKIYGT